jgi:hypothetical protein
MAAAAPSSVREQFLHAFSNFIHYRNSFTIAKQHFVAFFVFGENTASYSTKICSSVTGTKREAMLFLSGDE